MPRPTLNEIGNSGVFGKEIIASAHNENYSDILDYIDEVTNDIADHIASIGAHLDEAIINTSDVDGSKVKDALNKLKNDMLTHIGSLIAHTSSAITNSSSVFGSKVTDALNTLLTTIQNHIDSTTAHASEDITVSSSNPSITATNVLQALEDLQEEIGLIIAQSGTSDTEVVNARLSSVYGSFTVLKDRLDSADLILSNLDDDVRTAEVSSLITTEESVHQLGGATYKDEAFNGIGDTVMKGKTLINSMVNGDFADGTTGWTEGTNVSLSVTDKILKGEYTSSSTLIIDNFSLGDISGSADVWFVYLRVKVDFSASILVLERPLDTSRVISAPTPGTWYELYRKDVPDASIGDRLRIYAPGATSGDSIYIDGNAGVFAINMTALGIESYTEQQMLDMINGYFEGIGHANGTVTVTGKNLFDKNDVTPNTRFTGSGDNAQASTNSFISDFMRVKGGLTYKKSPHIADSRNYVAYYDNEKNVIGNAVITDVVTPTQDGYVRVGWYTTSLDTAQLEIGTVATDYQAYLDQQVTVSEFKDLPNGEADSYDLQTGIETRVVAPVDTSKKYVTVQSADITAITTLTNVQRVTVSIPNNVKQNSATGKIVVSGYPEATFPYDESADINKFYDATGVPSTLIYILKPIGTYPNLAAAQADLAEGGPNELRINYQLATPVTIQSEAKQINYQTGGIMYTDSNVAFNVEYELPLNTKATIDALNESVVRLDTKIKTETSEPRKTSALRLYKSITYLGDEIKGFNIQEGLSPELIVDGGSVVQLAKELNTTNYSGVGATMSETSTELIATGNGSSLGVATKETDETKVSIGDKYFVKCMARVTDAVSTQIRLFHVASGDLDTVDTILTPSQNVWYPLYGIAEKNVDDLTTWIQVQADYVDAGTANGKVLEIDKTLGITKIKLSGEDLSLSADELADKYPGYLETGPNHVSGETSVTGKNLFDKSKITRNLRLVETTGSTTGSATSDVSDYILIDSGIGYTISSSIGLSSNLRWVVYDKNKNFLQGALNDNTIPDNISDAKYVRISTLKEEISADFQLEPGTKATTYKSFSQQKSSYSNLKELPNKVKDTRNLTTGEEVRRVSDEFTFDGSEAWSTYQNGLGANNDLSGMRVTFASINLETVVSFGNNLGGFAIGYDGKDTYKSTYIDSQLIGRGIVTISDSLIVYVPTSELPSDDLAGFKTYLGTNNLKVHFQLATPVTTYHPPINAIVSEESTIYSDSPIAPKQSVVFNSNIASAVEENYKAIAKLGEIFKRPNARVYGSANQSINDASETVVLLDGVDYDTHSQLSDNKLYAKETGLYDIKANVSFATNATGYRYAIVRLNGTTTIAMVELDASATAPTILNLSTDYLLSEDDYLELLVYQNSGGALNVERTASYSPVLSFRKVN